MRSHEFQVGSKRCHDQTSKTCLLSQLGSGPDTLTSGSGHYTLAEYKEILKYAADRHIEVIPEFDMPGHGYAAIKSMEAKGSKEFLLSEANDKSRYCVQISSQYQFCLSSLLWISDTKKSTFLGRICC